MEKKERTNKKLVFKNLLCSITLFFKDFATFCKTHDINI
jgi:hypothetical protein